MPVTQEIVGSSPTITAYAHVAAGSGVVSAKHHTLDSSILSVCFGAIV